MIDLDKVKALLGEERLTRLANMPLVKERAGIEALLQAVCKNSAGPAHAIVVAIQIAGGVPQQSDVKAMQIEAAEIQRKAAEKPAENPAPAQADAKTEHLKAKKADK